MQELNLNAESFVPKLYFEQMKQYEEDMIELNKWIIDYIDTEEIKYNFEESKQETIDKLLIEKKDDKIVKEKKDDKIVKEKKNKKSDKTKRYNYYTKNNNRKSQKFIEHHLRENNISKKTNMMKEAKEELIRETIKKSYAEVVKH